MVEPWNSGREYQDIKIAGPELHQELASLLTARARILIEWADDDSLWENA